MNGQKLRSTGQMAADYPESPSEVPTEFDHRLSCPVHPSKHRGIDGPDEDAVGTRSSAEVGEGFLSLLVREHHNHSSPERPTYHWGRGCTTHTRWEEVDNAYTVVGSGGVVAAAVDEVVVGGGTEGDVDPVTGGVEAAATHKDEGRMGVNGHIQDQAGDSVFSSGSGPAAEPSHPEWGDSA
jgi:hypothetical protein